MDAAAVIETVREGEEMNEEKVCNAAEVASAIARVVPEHAYTTVWREVFAALMYEPNLSHVTAAGLAQVESAEKPDTER